MNPATPACRVLSADHLPRSSADLAIRRSQAATQDASDAFFRGGASSALLWTMADIFTDLLSKTLQDLPQGANPWDAIRTALTDRVRPHAPLSFLGQLYMLSAAIAVWVSPPCPRNVDPRADAPGSQGDSRASRMPLRKTSPTRALVRSHESRDRWNVSRRALLERLDGHVPALSQRPARLPLVREIRPDDRKTSADCGNRSRQTVFYNQGKPAEHSDLWRQVIWLPGWTSLWFAAWSLCVSRKDAFL